MKLRSRSTVEQSPLMKSYLSNAEGCALEIRKLKRNSYLVVRDTWRKTEGRYVEIVAEVAVYTKAIATTARIGSGLNDELKREAPAHE